jgi:hypothetical protein
MKIFPGHYWAKPVAPACWRSQHHPHKARAGLTLAKPVPPGKRAIELATQGIDLFQRDSFLNRDILAAAYAEAGDFENAVKSQQQAIELNLSGSESLKELQERLRLYSEHKPFRDN